MKRLEELMEAVLEPPAQVFLAGALTGGGVRFWPWYSRDPEETMRLVHKVLAGRPPFPVNFSFMEDPKWVWYHSFRGAIGP